MIDIIKECEGTEPLVSVIVLTYNRFDNILNNITSIIKQNYSNIELIIQDDGSKEFPKETIMGYLRDQKTEIKYIINHNTSNVGTVKNYNNAIKCSSGSIIVPLSQDDTFIDNMAIQKIVEYFLKTGVVICTAKRRGRESGIVLPKKADIELLEKQDSQKLILRMMYRNFISGAVLYFVKEAFYNPGASVFNDKYFLLEDWPFLFDCITNNIKVGFLNEEIIEFGEDGVSHQKVPSLAFLLDEKKLYEEEIIPYCERHYGQKTQLYITYQYEKIISLIRSYDKQVKSNKRTIFNQLKQKLLLAEMAVYAQNNGGDSINTRIDYLLKYERSN